MSYLIYELWLKDFYIFVLNEKLGKKIEELEVDKEFLWEKFCRGDIIIMF